MLVLIACECSGAVREAFRTRGHDAWSCDLKPAEDNSRHHFQCDLRQVVGGSPYTTRPWDLMIAHPDCRFLCSSGLHRNTHDASRRLSTDIAIEWVRWLMAQQIERIAIENPVGRIGTAIRPADQYIQPYEFGHDASKKTGLWLKNLPLLRSTSYVAPRIVNGRKRWSNQTDSGQNRLSPGPKRSADRARTYSGIAEAMADQWGSLA